MKQLRKTGNPLDANTRNDINYNWDIINKVMADLSTSEQETVNQFLAVKGDIDSLNKKDAELMQMILANTNLIEAMDLDLIKEQGDIAQEKGNTAKRQGDKAQSQGDKAEQQGNTAEQQGNEVVAIGAAVTKQGDYAKEQGDYAKEKAELAQDKITEITQAHNDLDALKVDAIKATQDANAQADNAKVEAENAKKQADYTQSIGDTVADKLDEIENAKDTLVSDASNAIETVIEKGDITEQQGLKAKEQGNYAQSVIDSYKHVGDWQGSVEYKKNQEVLFNGSTYRALEDNKGMQPTDKSVWQLIAQRGVDGEGAVASVNGIMPDSDGNVNLGDIASKEYVDDKIGDVDLSALETKTDATAKLNESKSYTDNKISEIPEVDLTPLETKEDAQAKLTEAKQYTDEKIGDVDLSALETKEDATAKLEEAKGYTNEHINSKDNPHGVTKAQVGLGNVPNFGVASKAEAEHGSSSTLMTPFRTLELIDFKTSGHINSKDNPHGVTKAQVGLDKVTNVEQMPKSGAEFSGMARARNNTSYTTPQLRNIVLSPQEPESEYWGNGDIWVVYKE